MTHSATADRPRHSTSGEFVWGCPFKCTQLNVGPELSALGTCAESSALKSADLNGGIRACSCSAGCVQKQALETSASLSLKGHVLKAATLLRSAVYSP